MGVLDGTRVQGLLNTFCTAEFSAKVAHKYKVRHVDQSMREKTKHICVEKRHTKLILDIDRMDWTIRIKLLLLIQHQLSHSYTLTGH